ncbi:MAG: helix-turn-helix domain-containing protein [Peptostreptococcaceae bacterium]|nr:helix-turn-helix domain-containing protein [Peptostreptococcaceae bacterium]
MSKININKLANICLKYKKVNQLNQVEMADLLSLNDQIYGKIERGQHLPKLDQIEKILEVTGNDFADILEVESKQDVIIALKGEAKSAEEKKVFNELIEMILCLDKHKNLRENNYGRY